MPRIPPEVLRNTPIILKKEKVFTLTRLSSLLGCSSRTAQTKMKQWRTYTSYNHNGKYYAMPGVPKFNIHGLWHYQGKFFSKHGNLKKTVVRLICASEAGLSGDQIGKLIGLSPQSFLHHFRKVTGIRRIKQEGVFVYFSEELDQHQQQVQKRLAVSFSGKPLLADAQAIVILVALIKHHDITVEDILALPEVKTNKIPAKGIQYFMELHGLQKKNPGISR